MHLIDSMDWPIIFGHRGASKYAPENTIASFDLALKHGAKAIELDTMLTHDGIPVVIHDNDIKRTTGGLGKVSDLTLTEIRDLDAGSFYSHDYRNEKVPILEEVMNRYKEEILINIELKNYHSPKDNLAEIVLMVVEKTGMLQQVIFSSFLPRNLRILKSINPEAKVALLCPTGIVGTLFRSEIYRKISPQFINPYYKNVNKEFILREHHRNRRVNVWTVNDSITANELIKGNVDGIITDDPRTMLELLRNLD